MKLKTTRLGTLALIAGAALTALCACDEVQNAPEEPGKPESGGPFTVTFHLNEGTMPENEDATPEKVLPVNKGGTVAKPDPDPVRQDHTFDGWYTDNETFTQAYPFNTPVNANLDLYAKWLQENKDDPEDPPNPPPDPGPLTYQISNAEGWASVVAAINTGGAGKKYALYIGEDFALPGSAAPTFAPQANTTLEVLIRGSGEGARALSLSGKGSLLSIAPAQTIVVSNLTLKGITTTVEAGKNTRALVVVEGGALVLQDAAGITDNVNGTGSESADKAGGVYVKNGGSLTMKDTSSVTGNQWYAGGGVYVENGGSFTMEDSATLSRNTATSFGGGVYVSSGGSVTLKGCAKVSANGARTGGGAYVYGTVTAQDNAEVLSNEAANSAGGGVYITSTGTVTLQDNAKVSSNTAGSMGGGIFIAADETSKGSLTLLGDAAVSGNTAASNKGGGIYAAGTFTMRERAVISGNKANPNSPGSGGGVHISDTGIFRMQGGTIYGATADGDLKNTAYSNAALNNAGSAQYGTFSEVTSTGTALSSSNNTITVVNGIKQP